MMQHDPADAALASSECQELAVNAPLADHANFAVVSTDPANVNFVADLGLPEADPTKSIREVLGYPRPAPNMWWIP